MSEDTLDWYEQALKGAKATKRVFGHLRWASFMMLDDWQREALDKLLTEAEIEIAELLPDLDEPSSGEALDA